MKDIKSSSTGEQDFIYLFYRGDAVRQVKLEVSDPVKPKARTVIEKPPIQQFQNPTVNPTLSGNGNFIGITTIFDFKTSGNIVVQDSTIGGLLQAVGNIDINNSNITKDVDSKGNITIDSSVIQGNIRAQGNVQIKNSIVKNGSIYAAGNIQIQDNSNITMKYIYGKSNVQVQGSSLTGTILAHNDLQIQNCPSLRGQVIGVKTLTIQNSTLFSPQSAGVSPWDSPDITSWEEIRHKE